MVRRNVLSGQATRQRGVHQRYLWFALKERRSRARIASVAAARDRERAAAGVFVAAAAKAFRYRSDIHRAFAAQAEPNAVVRQLAKEYRHLDTGDPDGVIHYAFAILFGGVRALHIDVVTHSHAIRPSRFRLASAAPSSSIFDMGLKSRRPVRCAPGRAEPHQFMRQRERVRIRAFVAEGTCIGEHGHVETGGHLWRDADTGGAARVKTCSATAQHRCRSS